LVSLRQIPSAAAAVAVADPATAEAAADFYRIRSQGTGRAGLFSVPPWDKNL
jgi:hypothetical protein